MEQLPLDIALHHEVDFSDFLPGPNEEVIAAVSAWAAGSGDTFLYLFGPSGCGKTHLLQAAQRNAASRGTVALYLPLAHPGLAPAALEGLEHADLVCLDDIQAVSGNEAWDGGLFGLYNRLREAGNRLLVSANAPVSSLMIELPDLRSRLGWGPAYRLRPLGEADCERLLTQSATRRGLDLGADAIGYIMRRSSRDAGPLLRLVEEIDRESLRQKRRPSLWLVRQILEARHRKDSGPE